MTWLLAYQVISSHGIDNTVSQNSPYSMQRELRRRILCDKINIVAADAQAPWVSMIQINRIHHQGATYQSVSTRKHFPSDLHMIISLLCFVVVQTNFTHRITSLALG